MTVSQDTLHETIMANRAVQKGQGEPIRFALSIIFIERVL